MVNAGMFFGDDSHLNDEGVALYVDALKLARTDRLPGSVREHVATCQACRKNVSGLFSLLADQDYSSVKKHPYFNSAGAPAASARRLLYRMAAVLVAAAGLAIIAYFVNNVNKARESLQSEARQQQNAGDALKKDSTLPEVPRTTDLYAANFTPLPELEDMVGSPLRSSSIEVRSPKIGSIERGSIVFDWAGPGGASLVLLDNRGNTVAQAMPTSMPFVMRTPAKPGLYYWKLLDSGEIAYVGKILVR